MSDACARLSLCLRQTSPRMVRGSTPLIGARPQGFAAPLQPDREDIIQCRSDSSSGASPASRAPRRSPMRCNSSGSKMRAAGPRAAGASLRREARTVLAGALGPTRKSTRAARPLARHPAGKRRLAPHHARSAASAAGSTEPEPERRHLRRDATRYPSGSLPSERRAATS